MQLPLLLASDQIFGNDGVFGGVIDIDHLIPVCCEALTPLTHHLRSSGESPPPTEGFIQATFSPSG